MTSETSTITCPGRWTSCAVVKVRAVGSMAASSSPPTPITTVAGAGEDLDSLTAPGRCRRGHRSAQSRSLLMRGSGAVRAGGTRPIGAWSVPSVGHRRQGAQPARVDHRRWSRRAQVVLAVGVRSVSPAAGQAVHQEQPGEPAGCRAGSPSCSAASRPAAGPGAGRRVRRAGASRRGRLRGGARCRPGRRPGHSSPAHPSTSRVPPHARGGAARVRAVRPPLRLYRPDLRPGPVRAPTRTLAIAFPPSLPLNPAPEHRRGPPGRSSPPGGVAPAGEPLEPRQRGGPGVVQGVPAVGADRASGVGLSRDVAGLLRAALFGLVEFLPDRVDEVVAALRRAAGQEHRAIPHGRAGAPGGSSAVRRS
ncbi:MAG: hypothetical protein V7633_2944 [Pseudonocardia sp.]